MTEESFEPIRLNAKAPGGERVLKSFDEIGAFISRTRAYPAATALGHGKRPPRLVMERPD